jgi:class 3 adenylate cyclase
LEIRVIEYVRHGDGFIAYRVLGGGPLDLLYMSGQVVSIEATDDEPHVARWYRRLSSIGRMVEFDLPGLGLSDAVVGELTLERIAECAQDVLDELEIGRAALIGAGAGGPLAVVIAATMPDRVRSLVLVNTYARAIEAFDYPIGYPRAVVKRLLDERSSPGIDWSARSVDGFALMNPSLKDDLLFRRWDEQAVRRCVSPAALARFDQLFLFADVRQFLSSIGVPTLVLTRRDNAMVPSAFGRYLAENIPGARFTEVPGDDYAPYSGDVDALVDELEEFFTGRRESTGDRVLTTLLFTDVVDSTARAVALRDRNWRAVLDNHDAAARAVIERYGGLEVNTTGDGFLAKFDSPTQAVRAAREIVTSATEADLAVRVGIHSGECERRGDDLAGITVHIAARVAARAEPSEVLVSRTVRDLLAGSELRFAERGEYRLKGLPDEWQLFALES